MPPIVHEVLRSPGQRLDPATRAFMEPRFGHDFGSVRVHTDSRARASARAVNALAYTVGQDVVFGASSSPPNTSTGTEMLAHELTHVVQQSSSLGVHAHVLEIAAPEGPLERSADLAGEAVAAGDSAVVEGVVAPLLQRQPEPGPAFNIQLTYPPNQTERHERLLLADALRVLRAFASRIEAHLAGGLEGHRYLKEVRDEQWFVSGVSDVLGGASFPPLSIWDGPTSRLGRAREAIEQGDVDSAASALQLAATEARAAERRVYEYREGTISGAEGAVFGLEVVQVASAAFVTAGTGGAAGVFLGAGYAGAQRLAGEWSSVHYGLRSEIDWEGIAFDTLFALVAGRFGGQLGNAIAARLGGRITARLASSLIVGRASGVAHAVARELFDSLRSGRALTVENFIDRLAEQLTLRAVFMDLVAAAGAEGTNRLRQLAPGSTPTQPSAGAPATTSRAVPGEPPRLRLVRPSQEPAISRPSPTGPVVRPAGNVVASGRSAFNGSAARQLVPAEVAPAGQIQPSVRPTLVPPAPAALPQPAPVAATGTGHASTPSATPSAVAIAAVSGSTSKDSPPLQVRLMLPPEKSAHADLYRSLVAERRLEHIPSKPRRTAQADNWDRELRPGGAMGMYEEIWQRFDEQNIIEERRLRPNWSRTRDQVDMQVDHRVEWQLLGAGDAGWGDSMSNYELLDQASNSRSGSTLRANIQSERNRLTALYGPQMQTQRIVFTQLIVSPGARGLRWLPDQIHVGEHYYALQAMWRHRTGEQDR